MNKLYKRKIKLCPDEEEFEIKSTRYAQCYPLLASNRTLFLKEDITKDTAAELSALLIYYDAESKSDPIALYINSNGGDVDALMNIYDVMQMVSAPIKTICIGKAYSAAAVILAAGDSRLALKNSKVMIHGVQLMFPLIGEDHENSKNYLNFVNKLNNNMLNIIAKHTGQRLDKVKEDCKQDTYLSAKEALNYGLIDKIV